jgi:predicted Zn finger-like uncharacterized protein
MKFVCDRCQTRYSIADEKVRQKILRIRCKTCGNVIVVQDEHASASGSASAVEGSAASDHFEAAKTAATGSPQSVPSSAPKAVPSSAPRAVPPGASTSAPKAVPSSSPKALPTGAPKAVPSSAPKAVPSSAPKAAPSSAPKVAPFGGSKPGPAGPPPLPPPGAGEADPLGGRAEWYLAIGGVRSGPFSRVGAAQKILAAEPGKKVHVWKEGMPGWKSSEEVSVIAREMNLMRPTPPPPPPPEPVKFPMPPTGAHPKVAAMPAAAARAAKTPDNEGMPLFPGKPLTPLPTSISDALDFAVDTQPGLFSDITTKKAKNIHDLSKESDKGSFADVTTKKGKNLRDLEAEPLFAAAPAFSKSAKTPPPVQPLPPVAMKAAVPTPAASRSANLPVAAPARSVGLPASRPIAFKAPPIAWPSPFGASVVAPADPFRPRIGSAATSSTSLPLASAAPASQPELGGFAEVIQAVAASDPPNSSLQVFPEPLTPPVSTFYPAPVSADLRLSKGLNRPGMKYVVAACVIVGLVILIVMLTLRMDTRKVADIDPAPAPAREPIVAEPPKPTAAEPPKPEPVIEAKPVQGTHSTGKHGSGKSPRHVDVGPAPVRPPEQKQPAKSTLPQRPNPFDESKPSVSQSQISAVVRSKANQAGLKSCYERALKMDNRLTSGRIDVTVSVGTSGTVQRVVINAPSSFILVEPCIKSAVKRWVFPPSSEEYGTNFPLIMQGGM